MHVQFWMFFLVPRDEWEASADTAKLFEKVKKHEDIREKHDNKVAKGKAGEGVHFGQLSNGTTNILDDSASTIAADAPGKQCIIEGCRRQTRDEAKEWCDPCFENIKRILDKKWPVARRPAACILLEWKGNSRDTDWALFKGLHPC